MGFAAIIPCYNAERTVERAVRSALDQTRAPEEVFVIDDGSKDGSVGVVEQIASTDPRVRLLHTERGGGGGARNAGIEAASTKYVALLDADDEWYPEHLERVEALIGATDDVAYMGWLDDVTFEGEDRSKPATYPVDEPTSGVTDERYAEWFFRVYLRHSAVVYRRERVLEVGGFDADMPRRHDIDLWLRVICGRTFALDPRASGRYTLDTPGAISRNMASRELYHFRAFRRNAQAWAHTGSAYDHIVAHSARRAMVTALTDGDREDIALAHAEALPYVTGKDRLLMSVAGAVPGVFGAMNRLRRKARGFG